MILNFFSLFILLYLFLFFLEIVGSYRPGSWGPRSLIPGPRALGSRTQVSRGLGPGSWTPRSPGRAPGDPGPQGPKTWVPGARSGDLGTWIPGGLDPKGPGDLGPQPALGTWVPRMGPRGSQRAGFWVPPAKATNTNTHTQNENH